MKIAKIIARIVVAALAFWGAVKLLATASSIVTLLLNVLGALVVAIALIILIGFAILPSSENKNP